MSDKIMNVTDCSTKVTYPRLLQGTVTKRYYYASSRTEGVCLCTGEYSGWDNNTDFESRYYVPVDCVTINQP